MENAIATYRAASETNDIEALLGVLAPDVELISPLSGTLVFRGREDLRVLLGAVCGGMRELHWTEEVGEGSTRVVLGEGRIGPFKLADAMVCELDEEGRIRRIRPYLRPWLGLTVLALVLGPRIAMRPGVILRAMRGG
jgi:hypothetical protein